MIVFLKLGGSLITDKDRAYTLRPEKLDDLVAQIASAMKEHPELQLILGHGSGSFGHQAASQFGTRDGVTGWKAWRGFAEVWYQASELNRMVVESLHRAGLPVITLSPAASITTRDGKISRWDLYQLNITLQQGLLPVIHGDVVFDDKRGGTILSTEDIFVYLAGQLHPSRILLAGMEAGVWEDFPARTKLSRELTPQNWGKLPSGLGRSTSTDVTGGMQTKVTAMLNLVEHVPGLEVLIFSGEKPDNVRHALAGATPGTLIHC
jgi:isopentenyl phosphate kinase